ncbi:MAG: SAM-dependent methyltransferase [Pseudomonadota bacterium]
MIKGSLVVVGCGIELGRHMTTRAISEIRAADTVFMLADAFAQKWLLSIRSDCRSLSGFYGDTKDRRKTYHEMEAEILECVRAGQHVCTVFYGHPGVFAQVSHNTIRIAREEGFSARMEAGISAEACLYADLGLDPGDSGVQSFEATQFLISDYAVNPSALLILWQVALSGNLDCIGFEPDPLRLEILVAKLGRWYPADSPVVLYEAAQLPVQHHRADRFPLRELPQANFREYSTLVIPPAELLRTDEVTLAQLNALDSV